MISIPIYRYLRDNGNVVDSLTMPTDKDFTIRFRVVAEEGRVLTYNGKFIVDTCRDVDSLEGWDDIENPFEEV
jgi:hypothetical protein